MKIYIAVFAVLLGLLLGDCKPNKVIYSNSGTPAYSQKVPKDTLWYLKNRMPDCDSALVFMKQNIVPAESDPQTGKRMLRESATHVVIPGASSPLHENEFYHFYVNPSCLDGKPVREALEMFCVPETVDSFLLVNKRFQDANTFWFLSVGGMGNYLDIRFEKGQVSAARFGKVQRIP